VDLSLEKCRNSLYKQNNTDYVENRKKHDCSEDDLTYSATPPSEKVLNTTLNVIVW